MGKGKKLLLVMLTALLAVAVSCSSGSAGNNCHSRVRVLMVQEYDSTYLDYSRFIDAVEKKYRSLDMVPEIRSIYTHAFLDMEAGYKELSEGLAALENEGWEPQVIFTHDNAVELAVRAGDEGLFDTGSVPVIAGAIRTLDWDMLAKHPWVVAFSDTPDVGNNIAVIKEMTGQNVVWVELDHDEYDEKMRNQFSDLCRTAPYTNACVWRLKSLDDPETAYANRDRVFIFLASSRCPETNVYPEDDTSTGVENTEWMRRHAWKYPHLNVKQDVFSGDFISSTGRPQFTAIHESFADGGGRYLCGYFSSWSEIADDMCSAAVRILVDGESPVSIAVREHRKDYYMDWQAMENLGLEYDDYSDRFHIVGAPLSKANPLLHGLRVAMMAILDFLLIALIVNIFLLFYDRRWKSAYNRLKSEKEFNENALLSSNCIVIYNPEDLSGIRPRLHPDYSDAYDAIMEAFGNSDPEFRQNLLLMSSSDFSYRWWQFRRGINAYGRGDSNGILIDIDDEVRHQQEMLEAAHMADESGRKEKFLSSISHQIRTPLNSIVGFAHILGSPTKQLSIPERDRIRAGLRDQTGALNELISDILQFSRLESGRINFRPSPLSVDDMADQIYDEWKDRIPEGIDFIFSPGRRGLKVDLDRSKVLEIANQYLSNAVKFTKEGAITLGWNYHYNTGEVEMYVEDTGCGIAPEKQKLVFTLFWKDDSFVRGTGLGLVIVKEYAKLMGGRAEVRSAVGIGSRFSVFFQSHL